MAISEPCFDAASRLILAVAGLSGATAVAGAAWASHAVAGGLSSAPLLGFLFLLMHAAAMTALALSGGSRHPRRRLSAAALWSLGGVGFAAAMTASGLGGSLGLIAPISGIAMIFGWLALASLAL